MRTRLDEGSLIVTERPWAGAGGLLLALGAAGLVSVWGLSHDPAGTNSGLLAGFSVASLIWGVAFAARFRRVELHGDRNIVVITSGWFVSRRRREIPRAELLYFSLPRESVHPPPSPFESREPNLNGLGFEMGAYEIALVVSGLRDIPLLRTRDFDLYHRTKIWLRKQYGLTDLDGYASLERRRIFGEYR